VFALLWAKKLIYGIASLHTAIIFIIIVMDFIGKFSELDFGFTAWGGFRF
jgi:hypothetical protein